MIVELLITNKGGGSENRDKFDPRDYFGYIDIVLPGIIEMIVSENGGLIDGSLLKTYDNVPLLWSDTRKVVFANLPCAILSLLGDRGLQSIQPQESENSTQFTKTNSAMVPVFSNLEAGRWDDDEDYYLEGTTVIFPKMSQLRASNFVKMKVIPATSAYGDNEEIRIPGKYAELLVQKVLALSEPQNRNLQKEVSDNNANTR